MTEELWTAEIGPAAYDGSAEKYQTAILEQYKLYVEMADRISARRALANTFFLTLNSAIFTSIGVFWTLRPDAAQGWLTLPFLALVVQCAAWFWLLRSYRELNKVKYRVIGDLEQRLPASPFWRAEWGQHRVLRGTPLSAVEQVLPLFFAVLYAAGVLVAVTS
ncbi:hypothetical protein AB0F72_34880 [Actinoplanes sp. NPDC023936]|uniref:RipA family octameric membrane protein n=1 Tax=Actinoplanes sp. NPDC023936 TaxID=3154910 RepID=UPI0033CF2530